MDEPLEVLRSWAVQDSPPGAATAALLARVDELPVGWLDDAIYERADRGRALQRAHGDRDRARRRGRRVRRRRCCPVDDAGFKAIVGSALPEHSEGFAEPVALAVEAVRDALDGVTLEPRRPARRRCASGCPASCCRGARAARAITRGAGCWCWPACTGGSASRGGRDASRRSRGPTSSWAGTRRSARRRAPSSCGATGGTYGAIERAALRGVGGARQGARARAVGTGRGGRGGAARRGARADGDGVARGVGLLAPGDPVLLGRDREALLPDPALRKKVWAASGGAGIVLVDGAPARAVAGAQAGQAAGRHGRGVREGAAARAARPRPSGSRRTAGAPGVEVHSEG